MVAELLPGRKVEQREAGKHRVAVGRVRPRGHDRAVVGSQVGKNTQRPGEAEQTWRR